MRTYDHLRKVFIGAELELSDLYLLESFQISYLPGWVSESDFACVIKHNPGTTVSHNPEEIHEVLISPEWNYRFKVYSEAEGDKIKYWKTIEDSCPMHETEI